MEGPPANKAVAKQKGLKFQYRKMGFIFIKGSDQASIDQKAYSSRVISLKKTGP